MPSHQVTKVYLKPLLPHGDFGQHDIHKVLKQSATTLLKVIRGKLGQQPFSDRAKRALHRHIKITVKPSSLVVTVDHPAFYSVIKGVDRKQMKWLVHSPTPIPIIAENGELIFRSATVRSMHNPPQAGPNINNPVSWIHPGRPASNFIEVAKEEARKHLKEKFRKALKSSVKRQLR